MLLLLTLVSQPCRCIEIFNHDETRAGGIREIGRGVTDPSGLIENRTDI